MLKPGDRAPEFELPDQHGNATTLSQFRGKTLVLYFTRYVGCPVCQMEMVEFSKRCGDFKSSGAELVIVTQSAVDRLAGFSVDNHFEFKVLSDIRRQAYRHYQVGCGLMGALSPKNVGPILRSLIKGYKHGRFEGNELQYPAQFIIDENQIVVFAHYGRNISDSLPAEELLARL
jgi:thioredoxin-dependent peroxiredoxin